VDSQDAFSPMDVVEADGKNLAGAQSVALRPPLTCVLTVNNEIIGLPGPIDIFAAKG
jgi:hypothetical protein